jgi:stress response protein SCP2
VPGTGEPLALRHRERRPLAAPNGAPLARLVAVDLDASVVAFDSAGNELGIVWQRHLNEFYGALQHTGDSREAPSRATPSGSWSSCTGCPSRSPP